MESVGLKRIQLFPSHPQRRLVFIDVIHKKPKHLSSFL